MITTLIMLYVVIALASIHLTLVFNNTLKGLYPNGCKLKDLPTTEWLHAFTPVLNIGVLLAYTWTVAKQLDVERIDE